MTEVPRKYSFEKREKVDSTGLPVLTFADRNDDDDDDDDDAAGADKDDDDAYDDAYDDNADADPKP